MIYSKEFIEKVKKEYPDWKDLHRALEMGDIRVGNYLAEKSNLDMDAEEIVRAFNEGREEDVFKSAEKCVRRKKLYVEWWNLQAESWRRKVAVAVNG